MADWHRVKSIFEELCELPAERRDESLDARCEGDSELQAAVHKLLAAHEDAGMFLGAPTLNPNSPDSASAADPLSERLPPRIGAYAPLEVIGEGGFGTVYRARQDTPVRRIVALKVIKPGMDTREVIARFEGERQALALMNHANIAAVLDAGATEEGRPYFVMEYVPGVPITTYCDNHRMPLRDRLQLFIQVCHAVQHAHQKGIIHRDIKPSNVLVVSPDADAPKSDGTRSDRRSGCMPIAKVIDFGVAKATDQRLTDHSVLTQQGMLVGTPEYMSPEQADLSQLDIDTRTDIYSLGVLLYVLVTGTLPFSSTTLRHKGFAEIQRIVREVEPPKPSTRLSSPDSHCVEKVALHRRVDLPTLVKHVRGELDWIIMKCMEKDRSRRYETANSIALDIERHLNNEPVLAGPPGAGYRLRKFVRRNRAAIVAVVITSTALVLGLTVSIVGFAAAVRERDVADKQRLIAQSSAERARLAASTAEAVNRFLQDMLSKADPRQSARRGMTVREALDRAVAKLDFGAMKNEPKIEAAIRLTVGRSYTGLGQFDAAEVQIEIALRAYRNLVGEASGEYAEALQQRGTVRKFAGHPAEAEVDLRAALAIQRARGDEAVEEAAACANDLALTLLDQQRLDEALPLLRDVLAFARLPENVDKPILAEAVNNMGSLHLARRGYP